MSDNINKEQFLIEHNKLSPKHLQVNFALLTKFQEEKRPMLKDTQWSHKLRIPLISWMSSMPQDKIKAVKKMKNQIYRNYPETH